MFGNSVLGISEMDRQDLNPRFSVEDGLRFREPPWFNKTRFGPRCGPTRTGVVMAEDCLTSSICHHDMGLSENRLNPYTQWFC